MSAPSPPTIEIDDGVIEEARRRQRRRRTGIVAAIVCLAALGAGLGLGLGGGSPHPAGSLRPGAASLRLMLVRGRPYVHGQLFQMVVRPYLAAGTVSLQINAAGYGGAGGGYPRRGAALLGSGSWQPGPVRGLSGEVVYFLAEPEVAAVRVPGVGIVKPVAVPQLPPGLRAVAFYRPVGSRGTIVPPGMTAGQLGLSGSNLPAITVTPLDSQGRPLPVTTPAAPTLRLPNIFFHGGPRVPSRGRCRLRSNAPGVHIQWGTVATQIAPDPTVSGPAFFTCLGVWYKTPTSGFQVGVVLNAQHPGAPPAALWGSTPVPGHPGLAEVKPMGHQVPARPLSPRQIATATARLTRRVGAARAQRIVRRAAAFSRVPHWYSLAPGVLTRRVGNALLLVENGSLSQQIAFLNTLTVTRLDLPSSH